MWVSMLLMSTLPMESIFLVSSRKLFLFFFFFELKYSRPFDVGFEALGQVVAIGSNISKENVGRHVIYTQYGAFSEYCVVALKATIPIPVSSLPFQKKKKKLTLHV